MTFDFNIYNFNFEDKVGIIEKDSTGVVKCKKAFPIYMINGKENIFKPLSKTKPLTTPLFGFSEVFWSTVIKEYFDDRTPLYRLAICKGYDKYYPSRYSKGTIVESTTNPNEKLVNLLEFYIATPDNIVNIKDYINYCGMYYDYTHILNSPFFIERIELGSELARQILISILKNDLNYHYENIAFIYEGEKLKSLAPPFDHEYSLPFLFPDNDIMYSTYFGAYNMALIQNSAINSDINLIALLNNIKLISEKYPEVAADFLKRLKNFIQDFQKMYFTMPEDYMEPFSTEVYQVYESIFKEHEDSKNLSDIPKFKLTTMDINEYSKLIQRDILISSVNYYTHLKSSLNYSRKRIK